MGITLIQETTLKIFLFAMKDGDNLLSSKRLAAISLDEIVPNPVSSKDFLSFGFPSIIFEGKN